MYGISDGTPFVSHIAAAEFANAESSEQLETFQSTRLTVRKLPRSPRTPTVRRRLL
jgi:hypothetical protein